MERRFLILGILGTMLLYGCAPHSVNQQPLSEDAASEAAVLNRASDLNIQLGMAYLREDRFDLAKLKFMRAVELEPTSPKTHYSLGYYYEKVGENALAEEAYKHAFNMAPSDPAVQNSYGVFLCRQGLYDRGESLLIQAATNSNFAHNGLAYENAGFCAVKAGKKEQALTYFKSAVAHNPRLVNSYYELAHISFELGRYQDSSTYLEKYEARANQTIESLELGIKLAEHFDQVDKLATLKEKLNENRL